MAEGRIPVSPADLTAILRGRNTLSRDILQRQPLSELLFIFAYLPLYWYSRSQSRKNLGFGRFFIGN